MAMVALSERAPATKHILRTRKMNTEVSNKVALITGGTSGIGLEAAKLFRDEGARVIVTGVNQTRLNIASREFGNEVLLLRANLRVPRELDKVFDQIRQLFGHLDILFATRAWALPRR
jgi:NAD(P)-dependent dehydrogenase (short-subunit alcohol dehydrogenase family)